VDKKILMFLMILSFLLLTINSPAEIKNPSKYRVINTTSKRAKLNGVQGLGVGNIIFSSQEMPKGGEDGYSDIRNTFYFGDDTSIHCRAYYPGTFESMIEKVKSSVSGVKFINKHAVLEVNGPGENFPLRAKMTSTTPIAEIADWDQERYQLLPYSAGSNQDFNQVNLSEDDYQSGQEYTVSISVYLKFQTGVDKLTGGPIYTDYLIAYGEFKYIKR